jgi:hypothetical protein
MRTVWISGSQAASVGQPAKKNPAGGEVQRERCCAVGKKGCHCKAMTRLIEAVVLVAWVAVMAVTVVLAVVGSFVRRAWRAGIGPFRGAPAEPGVASIFGSRTAASGAQESPARWVRVRGIKA